MAKGMNFKITIEEYRFNFRFGTLPSIGPIAVCKLNLRVPQQPTNDR
jgi:hypothetical protein